MALIGLTGYARSGKNTAADALTEAFGFKQYAFAAKLKEIALAANPWVTVQEWTEGPEPARLAWLVGELGWDGAKASSDVRRFLQQLGTGVRDTLGEDVWVKGVEAELTLDKVLLWDERGHWLGLQEGVITDVRFPNEEAWVHRMGGIVVRMNRTNADGSEYDNGVDKSHPSEAHVPNLRADYEIYAGPGELGWLRNQIRDVARTEREILWGG